VGPYFSSHPCRYLRLKWLSTKTIGGECSWPSGWRWHSTDDLSPRLLSAEKEWLAGWVKQRCQPADPSEVAFLQFTSGSTGHPKGVMISTRNLVSNILAMRQVTRAVRPAGDICMVSWLPQYHDMGIVGGCLFAPIIGFRADLMSPVTFLQHPYAWLKAISRLRATHQVFSAAPNFGYILCLRRVQDHQLLGVRLDHWRCALNGAEPIRSETLREFSARYGPYGFRACAWGCSYGLAENCVYVAGSMEEPVTLAVERGLWAGDVAIPVRVCEGEEPPFIFDCPGCFMEKEWRTFQAVRIVHPDTLVELNNGIVGEIWVSGRSVARGYWDLPDLSAPTSSAKVAHGKTRAGVETPEQTTREGPHLRTGDLGFIWQNHVFVVGRIKVSTGLRAPLLGPKHISVSSSLGCRSASSCYHLPPPLRFHNLSASFTPAPLTGSKTAFVMHSTATPCRPVLTLLPPPHLNALDCRPHHPAHALPPAASAHPHFISLSRSPASLTGSKTAAPLVYSPPTQSTAAPHLPLQIVTSLPLF
jgi:acyl-CoA synthetase (AMP-forming)/AMP-acid ligase II